MFTGNQGGDGEQIQIQSFESPSVGFRDLGLSEGGGWCMPEIPADLFPSQVRSGDDDRHLASFSLYAHKKGLRLPQGEFVDITTTLQSQLANYYRRFRISDPIPMSLEAAFENGTFTLTGLPEMNIPLICLKTVFEELEAAQPGMGFFVSDSIAFGHAKGLTTYDPDRLMSCGAMCLFYGADTDEEMLMEFTAWNDEHESTESAMEDMRNTYAFLPSDLKLAMGPVLSARPAKLPSVAAAKRLLKRAALSSQATKVLKASIKFRSILGQLGKLKLNFFHDQEGEQIGSLGFVVWDSADIAQEVVNHYEQQAYEGEAEELLFRVRLDIKERPDWDRAIQTYKLWVQAYAAFNDLLSPMEQQL